MGFKKLFHTPDELEKMETVIHSQTAGPSCVQTVSVLLPGREYDILIGPGLLGEAGRLIGAHLGERRCAIITDENVAGFHLQTLETSLQKTGLLKGSIVLPPGERTKSFEQLDPLCERLLELGLERGDLVVAFGGGVIGDLAGFAASILRRGIRFVQIPTSLLAQVDSSVGGKTGINTAQGKNLIGTFHQPGLVLADTDVLKTLPKRELRAGYGEMVKYGLIRDKAFFNKLESDWRGVMGLESKCLISAIETSVHAKADIVLADEREAGERALLNLGHTFGHALEAYTGYSDRLLHGEGVAIGMCLAFRFSQSLGLCSSAASRTVSDHLSMVGLPTKICDIPGVETEGADVEDLARLMRQDKKVRDGQLAFVLVRDIGQAFVSRDIPLSKVTAFLSAEVSHA